MAITIIVRWGALSDASLSLTFDAPRIVIGRGEGCDLRLPDPSVSLRHASLRQRGSEYVIVDEGSTNGTALDKVVLAPQSPRVVRSGELVRLGRVWLEIRIDPLAVARANPAAAKALALELVSRGLRAQGEEGDTDVKQALAEIERCPDELVRPADAPPPPGEPDEPSPAPPSVTTPEPTSVKPADSKAPLAEGGWSLTDGVVLLFALGVLVLSIVAFFWLLRR
jgi:predicted component of type VI protein secretion system